MPNVGKKRSIVTPPESDELNKHTLGLQWQWQANPKITYGFPSGNLGFYRINCIPKPEGFKDLWELSSLLLQKFPAETFIATAKLTFNTRFDEEEAGMVIMGEEYQYIALKREDETLYLKVNHIFNARNGNPEENIYSKEINNNTVYLRVKVAEGPMSQFSFTENGKDFKSVGDKLLAKHGRWIGA